MRPRATTRNPSSGAKRKVRSVDRNMTPEQKKANVRLGLVLASVAVVLFIGFMVKSSLFGI